MLNSIKTSLRINSTSFDNEILDLIEACKIDLKISGINNIDILDPLIKRVITLYVKANFGWDNPDSEKLNLSYIMLKQHLSISGDYNVI